MSDLCFWKHLGAPYLPACCVRLPWAACFCRKSVGLSVGWLLQADSCVFNQQSKTVPANSQDATSEEQTELLQQQLQCLVRKHKPVFRHLQRRRHLNLTTEVYINSEASAAAGDYLGVDATRLICRAKKLSHKIPDQFTRSCDLLTGMLHPKTQERITAQ